MKRVISVLLILVAVSAAGQAQSQARRGDVEGTWSARVRTSDRADGSRVPQLQLQMNVDTDDGRNWNNWRRSRWCAASGCSCTGTTIRNIASRLRQTWHAIRRSDATSRD